MKNGKKVIVTGATILALAVVGIGITKASGLKGAWGGHFQPCFHGAGMHPSFNGGDISDFAMWKLDRHVRELNLNETQTQEYEKVKGVIKRSILEAHQGRSEFHQLVRVEIDKDNPDMNALVSLLKERVKHIPEMVSKPADLFLDFFNTLDAEQKAQVVEMIRWRLGSAEKQN
jgi:hypothetical protein